MTNPKNLLSVALIAATLAAVFPFLRETAECSTLQKPGHRVTLINPCTGARVDTRVQGGTAQTNGTGLAGDVEVTRPLGGVQAMYEINAKETSASIGAVWNIISDVDNEPLYWQNLTVSNARKDGKATEREVTAGFRDLKVAHAVGLCSKKLVEVSLIEALVIGTRVIILRPAGDNNTRIEVAQDIKLSDIPLLFRGMMRNEIMKGTKEALDRIARAVQQRRKTGPPTRGTGNKPKASRARRSEL